MAKTRKRHTGLIIFLVLLFIVLAVLIGAYLFTANYFQTHFYPQTTINGDDVSLKGADEVEETFASDAGSYILAVHDRDGRVNYIKADSIDYKYKSDGSVQNILDDQDTMFWVKYITRSHDYSVDTATEYDQDKLLEQIDTLDCLKEENITEPVDAYIKNTGSGLEIVAEVEGNKPIKEQIILDIEDAVNKGETVVTLSDDDYEKPKVYSDDPELVKKVELSDKYKNMKIVYDVRGTSSGITATLEGSTIIAWISISDDLEITVDQNQVSAYVQQLASSYNTYAREREFKTSKGDTVTIGGGDYGWIIDKDAEVKQLTADIQAGVDVEREPCYTQRAFVDGENDIGETYIEIDYTNQHLYYYKKGTLVVESDIVSGCTSVGNGSPDGVFKIITLKSPATLTGEDYSSDVKYFMPFAYNVGLHDADWRSSFGGSIYKTGGSHGCVNLPFETAETIFQNVDIGTPVVAYYRDSVKLTSNNAKVSNAYSYSSGD